MAFNIQKALENLNERYAELTALVPDIFYFYDESNNNPQVNTNEISDGGFDMYDVGNTFYTNLAPSGGEGGEGEVTVPYTHTQAQEVENDENGFIPYTNPPMDGAVQGGNSYFGIGSSYFTNMYPGLFVLVASECDITHFEINGNLGSDGNGVVSNYEFNVTVSGRNYAVFCKVNGETQDPSINHIIIIPNGSNITHEFDDESQIDFDKVSNQSGLGNRVYYILVSRRVSDGGGEGAVWTGEVLTQGSAEAIAELFIEIVEGSRPAITISPVVTFEVIGYNLQNIITGGPLPDTLENTLNALNARTVWIETVGAYKHGNQFTVFGSQAHYLNKLYVNVPDPTLKVISWE
jgi:hypothetical protein